MRAARVVGAGHALAWYREAMRLWRRGPWTFSLLALLVLVADLALGLVPVVGVVLAQLLLPLVGCSLLYASLAADRGDRPQLVHAAAVLGAPPRAIVAVIASGLVVFVGEWIAAWTIGGVNMLVPMAAETTLTPAAMLGVYVVGVAVSLPFTFVPFAALFDDSGLGDAFAESWQAFVRNPGTLAAYGLLSLALVVLGWATYGAGLLLALPWWAASSYAAWKDVFGVRDEASRPLDAPPSV